MKFNAAVKTQLAGFASFILLTLLYFKDFLFNSATLLSNSDQLQSLGTRYMRDGFFLTQWDDTRLGGVPTVDAMFGDAYHPLVFLQEIMDPARAVGMKFVICVVVAYICGAILFTRLTRSSAYGVLLAVLYALSPHFFSHIYPGHDGKMMVMAVIPLGIYGIIIYLNDRKLIGISVFIISLVWMLLSSHLQMTYFFLWGAGFYSLFLNFRNKDLSIKRKLVRQLMLALGITAALAISAVQVIPPYVYTKTHSVRGTGDKTTIGHAVSWSLHQEEIASLILPEFIGAIPKGRTETRQGIPTLVPEKNTYWGHNPFKLNHDAPGSLLLLLGFLGFIVTLKKKKGEPLFWMGSIALITAYSTGAHTPFFNLFYEIVPGVKNFRAPSMVLFWLAPALAIMAAHFLKSDSETKDIQKPLTYFSIGVFALAVLRQFWLGALGGLDTVVIVILGALANAALYASRNNKEFSPLKSFNEFLSGISKDKKLPYIALNSFVVVAFFISIFSGNDLLQEPYRQYFKDLDPNVMKQNTTSVWVSVFLTGLGIGAIWYALNNKLNQYTTVGLLVIVALFELFPLNKQFVQVIPRDQYIQVDNPYIQAIQAQTQKDSLNDYRVALLSRQPAISGNILGLWNMRGALGFHDNELSWYRNFRGGQQNQNLLGLGVTQNPFLDLYNVGYIIHDQQNQTRIMKNATANERTTLYFYNELKDSAAIITALQNKYDYKTKVLLEPTTKLNQKYLSYTPPEPIASFDTVNGTISDSLISAPVTPVARVIPKGQSKVIANPSSDFLEIEVNSEENAIMTVATNHHPFWKARVNGKEVKTFRAFSSLIGVEVPKGKSKVEVYYQSDTIEASKPFVYIGITLLVALLLLSIVPRVSNKVLA